MPILSVLLAWLLSAGNSATPVNGGGIPFVFANHQIVLSVSVNGHSSLNFLLDTGTDASTVDEATARRIGLTVVPQDGAVAGLAPATRLAGLQIGDVVVDSLYAVAVDLSRVSKSLGRPLHGVLGHNFLEGRIVQINYRNHTLRFLDAPPAVEKVGKNVMTAMTFLPGRYIPVLDKVYVNEKPIRATLDTGSSMGLLLFPQVITDLGLEHEARRAPKTTALVYGGNMEVRRGPQMPVRVQAAVFDAVPIYFAGDGRKDTDPAQRGGNLGNEFFENTRLTLDYRNHQIIIER